MRTRKEARWAVALIVLTIVVILADMNLGYHLNPQSTLPLFQYNVIGLCVIVVVLAPMVLNKKRNK
ncbi:hypothetical protein [Chitinophaga sp. 212800010-3]|uniref:hypothetical protein n=1 Tax=unclassified Chitinophaga TaxID=2619133 RepID=UPI002DEE0665|nr:hypothetical protein [Chitinophaga sp. 212800010-3]